MAYAAPVSLDKIRLAKQLFEKNKDITLADVSRKTGLSAQSVRRIRIGQLTEANYLGKYRIKREEDKKIVAEEHGDEVVQFAEVRRVLKIGAHSLEELCDALDLAPNKVRNILTSMKEKGALLHEAHGKIDLSFGANIEKTTSVLHSGIKRGEVIKRSFGVTGDNHLCNKHSRLDVLNAAYDEFERRGISQVFHTGNMIDGEMRFNKTELVTAPGMDNQIEYAANNYPVRKGITTSFIAGDDHEGWYQQREGIEIGKYMELRFHAKGRNDMVYLGYGEHDVRLAHGSGESVMKVMHPGGGTAYAISYTTQKIVESFQGGEKPRILLAGHYHKFEFGYPREVYTVQTGCTCDQTMFMRKKKIQAHVGFEIINMEQDEYGVITQFNVEWFPFFDRKCYENRY